MITSEQSFQLVSDFSALFNKIKFGIKNVLTTVTETLNIEDQEELLQDFNSAETDAHELSREAKKEIQQRLIKLGYDPGTPDGIIGKSTRIAIYAYQANNDMRIDGKVTPALLDHLRSSQITSEFASYSEPIDL